MRVLTLGVAIVCAASTAAADRPQLQGPVETCRGFQIAGRVYDACLGRTPDGEIAILVRDTAALEPDVDPERALHRLLAGQRIEVSPDETLRPDGALPLPLSLTETVIAVKLTSADRMRLIVYLFDGVKLKTLWNPAPCAGCDDVGLSVEYRRDSLERTLRYEQRRSGRVQVSTFRLQAGGAATSVPAAVPAPAATPPAKKVRTVAECRAGTPRQAIFCLVDAEDPAAEDELLKLAHGAAVSRAIFAAENFASAAEHAGVIAGKIGESKLVGWTTDRNAETRRFAFLGLGHMLETLRNGSARGPDIDQARRERVLPVVLRACEPGLADEDATVQAAALACLGDSRDPSEAPRLVAFAIKQTSWETRRLAIDALSRIRFDEESAYALVPLVMALTEPQPPGPSNDEEAWTRADICSLLRRVKGPPVEVRAAAARAVDIIGDRQAQARDRCKHLAVR
jgi:hypothetical protein